MCVRLEGEEVEDCSIIDRSIIDDHNQMSAPNFNLSYKLMLIRHKDAFSFRKIEFFWIRRRSFTD